jgi:hypothetical protein
MLDINIIAGFTIILVGSAFVLWFANQLTKTQH